MADISVGIDDLAVYTPKLVLDMGSFEKERGIPSGKVTKGIGIRQMSVPDAHEDSCTLAAMALLRLLEQNPELKLEDIGRLFVGSESRVDHSKPNAAYILGMLERYYGGSGLRKAGAVDYTFACIGATYALENMMDWIRSGRNRGKVGIVIATDIARYELSSPGEYTQGAGAVAMLVKEDPRLLGLDAAWGTFTRDEHDFFRPLHRKTAVVDGHYSNNVYLEAMRGAWVDYCDAALEDGLFHSGLPSTDNIDRLLYHLPYPKMAEYAAAYLLRHEWRDSPRWEEIVWQIGDEEPRPDQFGSDEEFQKEDTHFRNAFRKTPEFHDTYMTKIASSLRWSRRIGNIYTGSIYLGLASLLENEKTLDLDGYRLAFGSYGSGCSAKVFSGTIMPEYAEVVNRMNTEGLLDRRQEIQFEDYEALHHGRQIGESIQEPSEEFALVRLGEGVKNEGYRYYQFV